MGNIKEITFSQAKYQCSNGGWVSTPNQCDNSNQNPGG